MELFEGIVNQTGKISVKRGLITAKLLMREG
jgi:hypothetical protein